MQGARRASTVLVVLLALAAPLAFAPRAARAQQPAPGVFTIASVHVDATAASAVAAREAARIEGQRRAFGQLVERLTVTADRARVPRQSDARLTELVRDFEVANEKSSAVRYIADYTFRFRADEIRRLFADNRIPYAETVSKPVVVVPVLRRGGGALLWDDPNPWRDAWANLKGTTGLVPLALPLGEAADVSAIGTEDALAAKPEALAAISQRYGGGDVLLALATFVDSGQLDTVVRRYSGTDATPIAAASFRPNPGEDAAALMARAAAAGDAELEEAWKRQVLVAVGSEAVLTADVPLASIADWLFVRNGLAGVPAVKRSDVLELGKRAARVEIHYTGDPARLQLLLAQRDLALTTAGTGWTLQRRGVAPAQ
jgi:hypothetical protein